MKILIFSILFYFTFYNYVYSEEIELQCECLEFYKGYEGSIKELPNCSSENVAFVIDLTKEIGECVGCEFQDIHKFEIDEEVISWFYGDEIWKLNPEDRYFEYRISLNRWTGILHESLVEKAYGKTKIPFVHIWTRKCSKGNKLL